MRMVRVRGASGTTKRRPAACPDPLTLVSTEPRENRALGHAAEDEQQKGAPGIRTLDSASHWGEVPERASKRLYVGKNRHLHEHCQRKQTDANACDSWRLSQVTILATVTSHNPQKVLNHTWEDETSEGRIRSPRNVLTHKTFLSRSREDGTFGASALFRPTKRL